MSDGGCEMIDYKGRVLTRKTATQARLSCAADRKLAVPEGEPGTISRLLLLLKDWRIPFPRTGLEGRILSGQCPPQS